MRDFLPSEELSYDPPVPHPYLPLRNRERGVSSACEYVRVVDVRWIDDRFPFLALHDIHTYGEISLPTPGLP